MKQLKKITSEDEYWKQHKIYKKSMNKLFRKGFKYLTNPLGFIDEIEQLLAEMEFIGLVSPEWSQGQRERLYRELGKPTEFKGWVMSKGEVLYEQIETKKDELKEFSSKVKDKFDKKYKKKINK